MIAFDNDSCTSYNFDLIYEDLMLFVDGNMRLLEPDNQNDLCQMIMNNMTRFNSRENLMDAHEGGSDSGGDAEGSIDEDHDTSQIDRGENKYSKLISRASNGTSHQQYAPKEPRAEITLAVEHKIFFNEALVHKYNRNTYRNEYDRNKLVLATNDKRKLGLR